MLRKDGRRAFVVTLDDDLARQLDAFCEHHFSVPRLNVIRRAIKEFLDRELAEDPSFVEALTRQAQTKQRATGVDRYRHVTGTDGASKRKPG